MQSDIMFMYSCMQESKNNDHFIERCKDYSCIHNTHNFDGCFTSLVYTVAHTMHNTISDLRSQCKTNKKIAFIFGRLPICYIRHQMCTFINRL